MVGPRLLNIMIRLVQGDIFESNAQAITITVNCKGAMGKGIALTAAVKYPELQMRYKELCNDGLFIPGEPRLMTIGEKQFLMFPTKDHWRNPSKIEWIDKGLYKIKQKISLFESLALPPLGCGNGGLKFYPVFNLMLKHLEGVDCNISVYPPKEPQLC